MEPGEAKKDLRSLFPMMHQIRNGRIIRQIVPYITPSQLLSNRLVDKVWNREARIGLKHSGLLEIKLTSLDRMNEFLQAFPPPRPSMRLLPMVDLVISTSSVPADILEVFGLAHGEMVHAAIIHISENMDARMEVKTKVLLKHFVNVQKISIQSSCTVDWKEVDVGSNFAHQLPLLQNLRKLEIRCLTTAVGLLHDMVIQAPNLKAVSLELVEVRPIHASMEQLLEKLKSFQISSLTLSLFLDHPPENTLLKAFIGSGVTPKELCMVFHILDRDGYPRQTLEGGKNLIRRLLDKITTSLVLESLTFRCVGAPLLRLHFPPRMTNIRTVDLGTKDVCSPFEFSGAVEPTVQLNEGQVPNLHAIVAGGTLFPFDATGVFPRVSKLIVEGYALAHHSSTWSSQFPNLRTLNMYILPGVESHLKPIFSQLENLEELKLTFNFPQENSPLEIWDVITGGIRPVMGTQSPVHVIVSQTPGSGSPSSSSGSQQASLLNLRRLRILTLELAPHCIFHAVVHFTAKKSLPRLRVLNVSIAHGNNFIPDGACLPILESYHHKVDVKN